MSAGALVAIRGATAAMGTRFEIVIAAEQEPAVRPWLEAALREIEDLHDRYSRFSPASLVSHINRTAALRPVSLDAQTCELLAAAAHVNRRSGGAFDIALGSGGIMLDRSARTIAFERHGVRIDLGAIAKGFALDRAAAILRDGGIEAALLHGGTSSVLAIGTPPGATAWRIALAHEPHAPPVQLADGALSVSRPLSQSAAAGGHIVDPRTGANVAAARYVVVIGPAACLADAWSTAIAVLGQRPGDLGPEWIVHLGEEHD